MDILLDKIDRLYRLKLHGGEVFLNPELSNIINYANSLKKVKSVRITTNGTIIPTQEILDALRRSKVVVQISDYDLPNSKKTELISLFQRNGISLAYLKDQKWKDMGKVYKRDYSRFNQCSVRRCTSLFDGKIYICSRAAIMSFIEYIDDYGVDISILKTEFRQKISRLYENDNEACYYCDGDTKWAKTIEPGIQGVVK